MEKWKVQLRTPKLLALNENEEMQILISDTEVDN